VVYVTFFAAHLAQAGGLSAETAGRLWGLVGLLSLVSGLLWGAVADRIGRLAGLAVVFALHATAFAVFALAQTGPSSWPPSCSSASAPGAFRHHGCRRPDYVGTRLAPAGLGFITIIFGIARPPARHRRAARRLDRLLRRRLPAGERHGPRGAQRRSAFAHTSGPAGFAKESAKPNVANPLVPRRGIGYCM